MTDRFDQELLLGYIEGELTAEEEARLELQLAEDPRLRSLLADLRQDRSALRKLPQEAAPPQIMEAVQLKLERRMLLGDEHAASKAADPVRTFRFRRALVYSGLAAMLLLSAGIVMQTLVPHNLFEFAMQSTTESLAMSELPAGRAAQERRQDRRPDRQPPALAMDDASRIEADAIADGAVDSPGDDERLALAPSRPAHDTAAGDAPTDSPAAAASVLAGAEPDTTAKPVKTIALARRSATDPDHFYARLAPAEPAVTVVGLDGARTNGPVADTDRLSGEPLQALRDEPASTTPAPLRESELAAAVRRHLGEAGIAAAPPPSDADDPAATISPADAGRLARQYRSRAQVAPAFVLNVDTSDASAAEQDVIEWARTNQVRIDRDTEEQVADRQFRALRSEPADSQRSGQREVVMVVQGEQVAELLAHLNRHQSQRAALVSRSDLHRLAPDIAPSPDAEQATVVKSRARAAEPQVEDALRSPDTLAEVAALPDPAQEPADLPPPVEGLLARVPWGRLLETQLPLSRATPLIDQRGQLVLPVVINEYAPSPATMPAAPVEP